MVNAPISLLTKSAPQTAGATKLIDGTPVKPMVRRIGEIGKKYGKVVATPGGRKFKPDYLNLTPELADHWIETYASMKADGITGKVTKDHLPRDKSDSVIGDMEDVFEDGGWLCCLHLVRGADNIRLAEANKDVSLETQTELISPTSGKKFKNFIAAISYVPDPVVTGQPMDAIAASLSGELYTDISTSQKDNSMDPLLCGIAKMCGLKDEEVNSDNALDHLRGHMDRMSKMKMEEEGKKASRSAELNVTYGSRAIDSIDKKRLSTNKIEKLKKILVSADGKAPSEIMASLSATYQDKALDIVESIVGVINEDDGGAVALGDATGFQKSLTLSRDDGSGDETPKKKNPWLESA